MGKRLVNELALKMWRESFSLVTGKKLERIGTPAGNDSEVKASL